MSLEVWLKFLQITLPAISFWHFIYSFSFFLFILFGGDANITSKYDKLRRNSTIMEEISLDTNEI